MINNNGENKELYSKITEESIDFYIFEKIVLKFNPRDRVKICSRILNRNLQEIVKREKFTERLHFATGLSTGEVAFWDVNQNLRYHSYKAHDKAIKCIMTFNDDFLVTGSNDCTVKLWYSTKFFEKPIRTYKGHTEAICCLLKIDEKRFVSGSNDHSIRLWNIESEECERRIKGST
jgi:WD40 repeat protein